MLTTARTAAAQSCVRLREPRARVWKIIAVPMPQYLRIVIICKGFGGQCLDMSVAKTDDPVTPMPLLYRADEDLI